MSEALLANIRKTAQILDAAKTPILKTPLIEKCSLNSKVFKKYENALLESGLLDAYPAVGVRRAGGRKSNRRMVYQTSVHGKTFLKLYAEIVSLMNGV